MSLISVIIPILNEATTIGETLTRLSPYPEVEVIVVDGGSTDGSREIVQQYPCQLLTLDQGNRALQMNAGADLAQGEILLFLHGDTLLPPRFPGDVIQVLAQPHTVAGAFKLSIAEADWRLKLIAWGVQWRSQWAQLPYGDQALFLKKSTFTAIGGFPVLPIMEDFVLIQQLKGLGTIGLTNSSVLTSPRRWQRMGIFKTTLINQIIIGGYYLGIAPDRLKRWYRAQR